MCVHVFSSSLLQSFSKAGFIYVRCFFLSSLLFLLFPPQKMFFPRRLGEQLILLPLLPLLFGSWASDNICHVLIASITMLDHWLPSLNITTCSAQDSLLHPVLFTSVYMHFWAGIGDRAALTVLDLLIYAPVYLPTATESINQTPSLKQHRPYSPSSPHPLHQQLLAFMCCFTSFQLVQLVLVLVMLGG